MQKRFFYFLVFLLASSGAQAQSGVSTAVNRGDTRLVFSLDTAGIPRYAVYFKGQPVILPSSVGFVLHGDNTPLTHFRLAGMEKREKDTTWHPVWGQESKIRDHHRQLTVHLVGRGEYRYQLDLEFRVFSHGVAFRYVFPTQPTLRYFVVSDELTRFNLAEDAKTFWIPGDYDTNEYPYTTSLLSRIDNTHMVNTSTAIAVRVAPDPCAVQTPLMMKTPKGLYINIHEAGLINYPAMQLHVDTAHLSLVSSLVPDAVGNKAYLKAPCHTPWRTIIVSDKATDILASRMILNLNAPSRISNASWIKPMKFVGVWWAMQTGLKTWNYSDYPDSLSPAGTLITNGRHGATTENVKRYIDFAAKYGFGGVLVEGWDTGWEDWFGHWKENVFDFVTPYPDFDVREISRYAASKGVKMIMHNETSGAATAYERQMDTAFRFMQRFGYTTVKTGYVGKIIPRGEHHDGQWMVNHYLRVAAKAAHYHIMLDAHEPVRPTGLQRTYPNWMASEAARGNEYNAFSKGNPPEHETILPFTRLIGGPMDYTPGIFKLRNYAKDSSRSVHTTLTKQLALYVTMYSPLQMVSDLPENYLAHQDAFQFIRDVPCDWDETRYLEAEPGDYLTIARKEKGASAWFIGAITDEHARTTHIRLDFLDPGTQYEATLYEDGKDADWKSNPESYQISHLKVTRNTTLNIHLASGGGTAISIVPIDR